MENLIEYFILNLDSNKYYFVFIKKTHIFEFHYKNSLKCQLLIKKIYKIKNPKLLIINKEDFLNIKDSHLEPDGKACLSLRTNVILTPEEVLVRIVDWCENLYKRKVEEIEYHDHGYRHGFPAVVEEYFSLNSLPLLKKYIYKVNEYDLFKIARKSSHYQNYSKIFMKKEWENVKDQWDEMMG